MSSLYRTNMSVLIEDGRTHQFVTTDGEVRACDVTSLATGLSIPIICCFRHAKCPQGGAVPNHYLQPGIAW